MRFSRLVVALTCAVPVLVSCSHADDASVGMASQHGTARVAIAPVFSDAAVRAYGSLASAGLDVVSAHIRLTRLDGRTLIDTTLVFPVTSDKLTIDLPVDISGSEETLNATVELRDATGAVQFATTQQVVAHDASVAASAPASVTLQYVGPGASAKTIVVTPSSGDVQPGSSQDVSASAFDANGASITGLSVTWSVSDATIATVASTGASTAAVTPKAARGLVTVTATAPSGLQSTARLNFLPVATRLVVISGGSQTGVGNTTLANPLVVELQGSDGKAIAGRSINFRSVTTDGEVGVRNGSTDADGRARTTMKLGRTAGQYVYEASSGTVTAVTVTNTATAAPVGAPTQIIPLTALPSKVVIGQQSTQVFSAQLADANGTYVRTAGIVITANLVFAPGGATSSVSATTDANGVFSFSLPIYNGPAGTVTISLTSPTIPNLPSGVFPVVVQ